MKKKLYKGPLTDVSEGNENIKVYGRRTPSDDKSSDGPWPSEL